MIPAKLIKDLEKMGFQLDFPAYKTNEDRIFDTLKTNNQRLFLAIPLILQYHFDYGIIINKLSSLNKNEADRLTKQFNKILIITNKIFTLENLNYDIQNTIDRYSIKEDIKDEEFGYYYDSFKDFSRKTADIEDEKFRENIKFRGKLNINKSLSEIFSPAKLRIMEKIFQHEKLTNTELKYYYRGISPLIHAILNESMDQYLRIIDSSKKYY
ncbi:hypothetical protein HYX06_03855 [Candidatus Woesearchaeota archaeon]|nr:hypothetical protein [Candidatus Woesearchaeota archaeon]